MNDYETDVLCPVCGKQVWSFAHSSVNPFEALDGILIRQAISNIMKHHAEESPKCLQDERWQRGPLCRVHKIKIVPVKADFPTLQPGKDKLI
jgi:hypothetical protein